MEDQVSKYRGRGLQAAFVAACKPLVVELSHWKELQDAGYAYYQTEHTMQVAITMQSLIVNWLSLALVANWHCYESSGPRICSKFSRPSFTWGHGKVWV